MIKRVLSWTGNLIFVAVVLYLCYFITQAVQDQAPSVFGYRMLRVLSDSMEPEFGSGDCILVKEAEPEELAVGDIITFHSADPTLEGNLNTHRIVDIVKDYTNDELVFYTKGDNNSWNDDYPTCYEDVVGKYVKTLAFGKTLSAFLEKLSNRSYYFAIVIIPILLCFLSTVLQLVRSIIKR